MLTKLVQMTLMLYTMWRKIVEFVILAYCVDLTCSLYFNNSFKMLDNAPAHEVVFEIINPKTRECCFRLCNHYSSYFIFFHA